MESPNADSSSESTQERLIVKAKRPSRKRWALRCGERSVPVRNADQRAIERYKMLREESKCVPPLCAMIHGEVPGLDLNNGRGPSLPRFHVLVRSPVNAFNEEFCCGAASTILRVTIATGRCARGT